MTINIAINDSAGINFASYFSAYDSNFNRASSDRGAFNYGLFGSEYTISDSDSSQGFIASGNFLYNLSTHQLTGTTTGLQFGNSVSGSIDYTLADPDVTITGLNVTDATSTTTNELLLDLMNGNTTELYSVLSSDSINFTGGAGNDSFAGFGYADRLNGGAGNDTLTGNGGNDTFVFNAAGFGADTLTDFDASGDDVIEFSTSVFTNWAAVQAALTTNGAGEVVVYHSAGNQITLAGVTSVSSDDFTFV